MKRMMRKNGFNIIHQNRSRKLWSRECWEKNKSKSDQGNYEKNLSIIFTELWEKNDEKKYEFNIFYQILIKRMMRKMNVIFSENDEKNDFIFFSSNSDQENDSKNIINIFLQNFIKRMMWKINLNIFH